MCKTIDQNNVLYINSLRLNSQCLSTQAHVQDTITGTSHEKAWAQPMGFTRAENPRVTRGTARWLVRFVTRVKSAQVNFNSILFPFCLESFFVLRDKQSLTYYSKKRELNLFSFKSSSSDSRRSYLPTSIWLKLNGSNRR